jgi:hypothetical protein
VVHVISGFETKSGFCTAEGPQTSAHSPVRYGCRQASSVCRCGLNIAAAGLGIGLAMLDPDPMPA